MPIAVKKKLFAVLAVVCAVIASQVVFIKGGEASSVIGLAVCAAASAFLFLVC